MSNSPDIKVQDFKEGYISKNEELSTSDYGSDGQR